MVMVMVTVTVALRGEIEASGCGLTGFRGLGFLVFFWCVFASLGGTSLLEGMFRLCVLGFRAVL